MGGSEITCELVIVSPVIIHEAHRPAEVVPHSKSTSAIKTC